MEEGTMANSHVALLHDDDDDEERLVEDGSLDLKGHPAVASKTGGTAAAAAVIGFIFAHAAAISGISYNLALYMMNGLGFSSAAAASSVNLWTCVHDLCPLLGAYVADAHIGRYKTSVIFLAVASTAYLLLALVSFLPGGSTSTWHLLFFFLALYMVAIGKGFSATVVAFGADQFDENNSREFILKSSYFTWYFFFCSLAMLVAIVAFVYVGDELGFRWAAVMSAATMLLGSAVFFSGTTRYRYKSLPSSGLSQVKDVELSLESRLQQGLYSPEEAKVFFNVLPIWLGSTVYEMMKAQTTSLFVEQGALMDTRAGNLRVPPASLNCFDPLSVLIWTVLYDRVLNVFAAQRMGNLKGFTFLQRMAIGLLLMTMAMVSAAMVESERLNLVHEHGPERTMSIFWQVPQFTLVGASKVFYCVGIIEFMYDQVPQNMRTMGVTMPFISASAGNLLSGVLVTLVSSLGWIPRDLNRGHLDYFFWLLSALSVLNCLCFLVCSSWYKYRA